MKSSTMLETTTPTAAIAVLAGLAGGLAEVAWIVLCSSVTPAGGAEIASQITASLLPDLYQASYAAGLGIAIHFLLSAALGLALVRAFASARMRRFGVELGARTAAVVLGGIWAVNFFVILPLLNPAFVTLLPYEVSFVSKLLFGLALAFTLKAASAGSRVSIALARA